ncbi:LADA_0G16050g1_1 [Lachancea dasiensis]|uniref:LADA_0G16050g1_1 n=1 Tax=Lachancea dasiensis TaxID=1072105 RepID=A0A1G4JWU3_9SACH|nr:LADA_0G16050g1_1 [Lachancea dasiensis]
MHDAASGPAHQKNQLRELSSLLFQQRLGDRRSESRESNFGDDPSEASGRGSYTTGAILSEGAKDTSSQTSKRPLSQSISFSTNAVRLKRPRTHLETLSLEIQEDSSVPRSLATPSHEDGVPESFNGAPRMRNSSDFGEVPIAEETFVEEHTLDETLPFTSNQAPSMQFDAGITPIRGTESIKSRINDQHNSPHTSKSISSRERPLSCKDISSILRLFLLPTSSSLARDARLELHDFLSDESYPSLSQLPEGGGKANVDEVSTFLQYYNLLPESCTPLQFFEFSSEYLCAEDLTFLENILFT